MTTIDPQFRKKLDKLSPDRPFSVIVHPKPPQGLEGTLNEHDLPIRNEGESQTEYNQRLNGFIAESLQPLCQYLDERGIKYNKLSGIGFVSGSFKIRDIYQLAEQPFIDSIIDGTIPLRAA